MGFACTCKPDANTRNRPYYTLTYLKSSLDELDGSRAQGGPFYSHSERPTVGRPRARQHKSVITTAGDHDITYHNHNENIP